MSKVIELPRCETETELTLPIVPKYNLSVTIYLMILETYGPRPPLTKVNVRVCRHIYLQNEVKSDKSYNLLT